MRSIESKQLSEKKRKRNQIIIGIVLVIIMLGSTFGIIIESFGNQDNSKINFNGLKFVQSNNLWTTQKDNFNLYFTYNPLQIFNLSSQIKSIETYSGKPLYIYSESREAEIEIYRNLDPQQNLIVERIQEACPQDKNCSTNIPVKDCTNNFIIIEYSDENETQLSQENGCVLIKSPPENIVELTDTYLFKLFKIIN